jgi:hypothetical protein
VGTDEDEIDSMFVQYPDHVGQWNAIHDLVTR